VKCKKENELSFYALHQNQLLSEVLFSTARFVPKKLVHPVIWSEKLCEALRSQRLCV
jgi:hypothetical protein